MFLAGEGVDLIREAVQVVLQEMIEIEVTEAITAARYERSQHRVHPETIELPTF